MKFIADSMLGRLARWLRLLGHDTVYHATIEDSLLLRIAREENRILLTRDTRIVKRRGVKHFLLLTDNDTFKQLKKVITTFDLIHSGISLESGMFHKISRCSLCNTILDSVPKEEAKDGVPEYVYLTTESFKKCIKCDKFYWMGTHHERFRRKLIEILS